MISEIEDLGFTLLNKIENMGIHFEKYHSPHYIQKVELVLKNLKGGLYTILIRYSCCHIFNLEYE